MGDVKKTLRDMGEQVAKWAKSGGSTAAEWWEEKSSITARTGQIRRLSRRQREVISEIGTKVFTLHKRGKVRNRELLADCERIDEINAEIDRLKAEIEDIRTRRRQATIEEKELEDDSPVVDEDDVGASVAVEVQEPKEEEAVEETGAVEAVEETEAPEEPEKAEDAETPGEEDAQQMDAPDETGDSP